ncbi:AlpA family transcriptional regulator [Methylomonas sp. ZR1]|uniref:helix-turn-helix transcriptional regulator n=1 Tax=Methylomonas sp. ZR1 TaxID=1797072 RepID=UPI00149176B4|nr:AlpA family phage regulatory protein [Methylomonas sp. ZR1]NOV28955.1 AlpA family phage regulatory protein [Methylomonas sp. ZR1]
MVAKPDNAQRAPTANRRRQRNKITYTPAPLPAEGFVRLPSVLGVLGVSKSTFLNGVKDGKYPAGTLLSPRCRVWPVDDIRALLDKIGGA